MNWRRDVWGDGEVSLDEADALFAMNRKAGDSDKEWADFFAEALSDFLIRRGNPKGFVTDADADWLIDRLGADGRIDSLVELNFLDHLFERADFVPAKLKAYALDVMEQSIAAGSGPTRDGSLDPGAINATEAKLLRRFVFAPSGDGPAHVSRAEAEMLWRLKDGALGKDNSPEWKALFVQGVGNHLLAAPRMGAGSREEALKHQAFLNDSGKGLDNFIARMLTSRPDFSGFGAAMEEGGKNEFGGRLDERDNGLDAEEKKWTEKNVIADGDVDPYEHALLEFVVR